MSQSTGGFNVGRDGQVVAMHPLAPGGVIATVNLTSFDAKKIQASLECKRLDGPPLYREIPNGWSGTIDFDRADSTLDDLANLDDATFWAGSPPVTGNIFQYITELDGSTSSYQYVGVAYKFSELGKYAADAAVKQTLSWKASQRVSI